MEQIGPDGDIVISSRIRLARNLEEVSFPVALTKDESKEVIERVRLAVIPGEIDFQLIQLEKINELERHVLVEKHLISPSLMANFEKSAALFNEDESISIMINEEDHIRIQCLLPGFQLNEAYDLADRVDDLLEEKIQYAFHEELGYLTSCPTNVGTGIRASVMVHLPALTMTGNINGILQAANQMGLAIRGIYGEGTEFLGNLFQISNQLTLGRSEKEIIETLKDVTHQIIQKERETRNHLLVHHSLKLEDRIYRSYGILRNARILTSKECMKFLSDVRLGVDLEILKDIKRDTINQIMVMTQPAYLQKIAGDILDTGTRDMNRASLVRGKLISIE